MMTELARDARACRSPGAQIGRDLLPGTPLPGVYEVASHWEIKALYCTVAAEQGT